MNRPRLNALAITATAVLVHGCATSQPDQIAPVSALTATDPGVNAVSAVTLCPDPAGCAGGPRTAVHGAEVGIEKNAPVVAGHPVTAVVVTQCNLVVAVYMTMPDGKLLRFDRNAEIPAEHLVSIAYTATRSERVEVSCNDTGAVGYETHGPT